MQDLNSWMFNNDPIWTLSWQDYWESKYIHNTSLFLAFFAQVSTSAWTGLVRTQPTVETVWQEYRVIIYNMTIADDVELFQAMSMIDNNFWCWQNCNSKIIK